MTRLGKFLVLFNFAFGLFLATWSFNFYANGIDWTDRADKGVPVGQTAIRAAKLAEMWNGVAPAQANWLTELGKRNEAEKNLVAARGWYDKKMHYALFGPAKGKGVFEVAVADKDAAGVKKGQILLDAEGNPLLVQPRDSNDKPLQLLSLAEYNNEDEDIRKSLKAVIDQHVKQIEEAVRLTNLIIGDKDTGQRGFHERIADEKAKNLELAAEYQRVKPRYINTMVEAQLINKRRNQMLKRIEELKKVNVASK